MSLKLRDCVRVFSALCCVCVPWASAAEEATILEQITVTATREKELLVETPASVGIVKGETMAQDKPTHPSQVMSQMPGVAIAVTNGEGHTTAIRQPFTTNPVYLFLEDGIPTRSTGFFNHNALYEINIPQSGGVEVIRGPASALYGSDAIGGVVNVLTRTPPTEGEFYTSLEAGDFGWRRALVGGGNADANADDGWRADLNYTTTDGWRDTTAYERKSGTFRWDHVIDGSSTLKTVAAFSAVDQETGANSPLIRSDYENSPTRNYFPIAFRKVGALRLSTTYERQIDSALLSVTPYLRDNSMDLLASFTLNSDPTLYTTQNKSYGLMAKWRQDFEPMRTRLIAGVDLDMSPGERLENRVITIPTGVGASRVFTSYTLSPRIYEYEVTYSGVSPYVHGEFSPIEKLRVTAGLRYDSMSYDFDNRFDVSTVTATAPAGASGGTTRVYGQAGDTKVSFQRASPKLGATYALNSDTHVFASYNQGFRAPSEGQIFRPSSATTVAAAQALTQSALGLKPIKASQAEIGLRGLVAGVSYDVAVYDLEKRDDIVSVRDPATNFTQTVNAGRTRHRGVEVSLGAPLVQSVRVDVAYSHARHEYVEWVTSQGDFSGKEMESAPRVLVNTRVTWAPLAGSRLQLEWVKVGSYWMDAANTTKYEGHDLFNLRGNWQLSRDLALFGSVYNIADKRYADSASISSNTPVFSPGLPRMFTAGIEARW